MADIIDRHYLGWSPEQIAGRISHDILEQAIGHKTIYQFIYDRGTLRHIDLRSWLPCRHRKSLQHGHSCKHRKSLKTERVHIKDLPLCVNRRHEPGQWKVDIMVSRQNAPSLYIVLERPSRWVHIAKLAAKTAREERLALNRRLNRHPERMRKTITYDNGSENVEHILVNKTLCNQSYFFEAYQSWEKGSLEHASGLIRRLCPKKTDFATISIEQPKQVEDILNNRPLRIHNYKTPKEVFTESATLVP
jgi:IS30 family transposase